MEDQSMKRLLASALFIVLGSPAIDAIAGGSGPASETYQLYGWANDEAREARYHDRTRAPEHWQKALEYLEKSYATAPGEREKLARLGILAAYSFEAGEFDKAKDYATRAVAAKAKVSPEHPADWVSDSVFHGHMVLGKLALRDGDTQAAGRQMLEAARTAGSPGLNSFGPNMSLAKLLLERGERTVVVEYLHLCETFWTCEVDREKIPQWISVVESGGIPDFGANLFYGE
jgi:tetratricopeptide (TPR) repeat protein